MSNHTVAEVFAYADERIASLRAELAQTSSGDRSVYGPLKAALEREEWFKRDLEIVYGGHFDRKRERPSWWVVRKNASIPMATLVDHTPESWGGTGADYGAVVAANEALEEGDYLIEFCPAQQGVPEDAPAFVDRVYVWRVSGLLGIGSNTGRFLMAVGPETQVRSDVRKHVRTLIPQPD